MVGAGEPEATPLTVSAPSNACFGWEVQRKAGLMRTFRSGLRDARALSGPQWVHQVGDHSGRFGAGGRLAGICAAPGSSPFSYMIIAASVSAFWASDRLANHSRQAAL
jgi:hypothetical protein